MNFYASERLPVDGLSSLGEAGIGGGSFESFAH